MIHLDASAIENRLAVNVHMSLVNELQSADIPGDIISFI